jgi:hypothetical protein
MARPKQIAIGKQPSKILAMAGYQRTSVTATEKFDNTPIIPYFKGDSNQFPTLVRNMYERGSVHRAAVQLKHRLACGDGIIVSRKDGNAYEVNEALEAWLKQVNPNQSVFQVMIDQLLDCVLCGAVAGQVTGDGAATTVYHEDFSTVRLATPPKDAKIEFAYISNMWDETELRKPDAKNLAEYATRLPLFNHTGETSLLIVQNYTLGRKYYPIPDYYSLSFKRWVDIEYKIPTYNDSQIDNGWMPSGILTMYGDPPQDMTPTEYANKIQDNFTGEGNNAKLITQLVSNKESAPEYVSFSNEPDGIFMSLDTLTQQNILRAHKLHPTLLMSTAGSLGQSSEIKTLFDWFYATVIDGYQKMVLEFWDKVLEHAGFGQYRLEIANNNPISMLGSIDISKYLSVNEVRVEMGYDPIEETVNTETLIQLKELAKDAMLTQEQRRNFAIILGLDADKALLLFPNPTV